MKVTILLADYAEAVSGKLYVMGGGWSITRPPPSPMAIALKIEVPWAESNRSHRLALRLVDEDGRAVQGDQGPVEISADFEVGRPPGLKSGTPLDVVIALNVNRGPLPPSSRFQWRLSIDDEAKEDWFVQFSTRAT